MFVKQTIITINIFLYKHTLFIYLLSIIGTSAICGFFVAFCCVTMLVCFAFLSPFSSRSPLCISPPNSQPWVEPVYSFLQRHFRPVLCLQQKFSICDDYSSSLCSLLTIAVCSPYNRFKYQWIKHFVIDTSILL